MSTNLTSPSDHDYCDVSVALCVYNGSKYLQDQLRSFLEQSLLPNELVICDDCSTDNSVDIIKQFSMTAPFPVRLIVNSTNIGFTQNFSQAIRQCRGDIIFLSDQDDIWYPDKIKFCTRILSSRTDLVGMTHNAMLVDEAGIPSGFSIRQQIKSGYGRHDRTITGCLSCFKRTIQPLLLPVPEKVNGHDLWMTYIFSYFKDTWHFSDVCLQDLRRHSSNTSEWVANSFKPLNHLDVFLWQFSSTPAADYADRLAMNQNLFNRIPHSDESSQILGIYIDEILEALKNEYSAICKRQLIADTRNGPCRFIKAILFHLNGGYSYFNGFKSLLRDVIRK